MKQTIKPIWELIKMSVADMKSKDSRVCFDDRYEEFENKFELLYEKIKDQYMKKQVTHLDRHKVAAVIIISVIETHAISYIGDDDESVFLGNQMAALNTGLLYMLDCLNYELQSKGWNGSKIENFYYPEAMACDTKYFDIMTRNLFLTEKDYVLNPLDLADKLFLLEYLTLIKSDIDPSILKEKS